MPAGTGGGGGAVEGPRPAATRRSRSRKVAGAGGASLLPRKGVPGTRPLGALKQGGGGGSADSQRGALSPAARPLVCEPAGCPGVEPGPPLRSQAGPRPPPPPGPRPVPPPRACPRGEAHGLSSREPGFLFDNIPRRPLFVFIVSERERISELKLKKPSVSNESPIVFHNVFGRSLLSNSSEPGPLVFVGGRETNSTEKHLFLPKRSSFFTFFFFPFGGRGKARNLNPRSVFFIMFHKTLFHFGHMLLTAWKRQLNPLYPFFSC